LEEEEDTIFMSSLLAAAHKLRRRKTLLLMSSLFQVIGFWRKKTLLNVFPFIKCRTLEREEDTLKSSFLSSGADDLKGRTALLVS